VSANPVPILNYTQILRRSWELTGTAYASENQSNPHDWDYQAAKIGIEHKRDLERTLLYGVVSKATASNGQPVRTTGGLFNVDQDQRDGRGRRLLRGRVQHVLAPRSSSTARSARC
jgi:hypothetical protein